MGRNHRGENIVDVTHEIRHCHYGDFDMSNKRRTNELRKAIAQRRLYFDGGCGTMLQAAGLPSGTPPETWNITAPTKITALHTAYLEAGCDIITTNTFGVNRDKTPQFEQNILAAVQCAQNAVVAYEKKDPDHV